MGQKIFKRYDSFLLEKYSIQPLDPIELILQLPQKNNNALQTKIGCSMIFFIRILQEK